MSPLDPAQVAALRRAYGAKGLHERDLAADPVTQFGRWFEAAVTEGLPEPNAMVVATATPQGVPSARTVLLKGFDERGFVFYTNYGSRKGRELAANPRAALVFPWFWMERQVTVTGAVERVDRAQSAAYFASRPRASQLGAAASEQSAVVPSREALDERYAAVAARWPEGTEVPLPEQWGGLRVVPDAVEFWQGRLGRLHDRLRYARAANGWRVQRLSP